jgi:large subunit ribosomal protein L18
MNRILLTQGRRKARARRTRAKVRGTSAIPRLHVFRSSKQLSAQIIDDEAGRTLVGISEKELAGAKGTKTERAQQLGEHIAKKAIKAGVEKVVFDRGPYLYHGRIAAFAEAARKGGLRF